MDETIYDLVEVTAPFISSLRYRQKQAVAFLKPLKMFDVVPTGWSQAGRHRPLRFDQSSVTHSLSDNKSLFQGRRGRFFREPSFEKMEDFFLHLSYKKVIIHLFASVQSAIL